MVLRRHPGEPLALHRQLRENLFGPVFQGASVRARPVTGIAIFATLLLAPCLAQEQQDPPLRVLLAHLQANLNAYLNTVPSFFCDEHVDSVVEQAGAGKVSTA